MRQKYFFSLGDGGFHRIAYTEWGDHDNPHVVVCVHGLARNSRDFDFLAEALASDCRVVCMDVVGRGDSDWLDNKSEYAFSTYLADAAAMLARVTAPAAGTWRPWRGRASTPTKPHASSPSSVPGNWSPRSCAARSRP